MKEEYCDGCNSFQEDVQCGVMGDTFGGYCKACRDASSRSPTVGYAQYSRDRDREDHAGDMLQPRDRNGKPNKEFIRHYKEEAESMFTQEELKNHS